MATKDIAGYTVEVDDEGFMTDHTAWNEAIAIELAKEEGLDELTDRHKEIIAYFRSEFESSGTAPSIRKLNKSGVVPTKELYELFPGGPAKKAARIAGLKKPQGCI